MNFQREWSNLTLNVVTMQEGGTKEVSSIERLSIRIRIKFTFKYFSLLKS